MNKWIFNHDHHVQSRRGNDKRISVQEEKKENTGSTTYLLMEEPLLLTSSPLDIFGDRTTTTTMVVGRSVVDLPAIRAIITHCF